MEELISSLKNIINSEATYNCFAIKRNSHSFIGTKVQLTNEQLCSFMSKTITYLCNNIYNKMSLDDYPVAAPKDYAERLLCTDEKINKDIISLKQLILNPETNVTNPAKYNAYMITVDINNSTHIFITKKKLFNTYNKKNFIYTLLSKGDYKEISDKFIRLIMHFDAFILDNKCYIITLAGRRLFQLEDISLKESIKTKNLILEKHLIKESDICIIDKYLSTPRHYSSLANPDYEIINELSNINKRNKKKLEQKYQLPIIEENGNWYIDISSNEKLKDFLDTINHKRALNFNNEIVHCKSPFTLDS